MWQTQNNLENGWTDELGWKPQWNSAVRKDAQKRIAQGRHHTFYMFMSIWHNYKIFHGKCKIKKCRGRSVFMTKTWTKIHAYIIHGTTRHRFSEHGAKWVSRACSWIYKEAYVWHCGSRGSDGAGGRILPMIYRLQAPLLFYLSKCAHIFSKQA